MNNQNYDALVIGFGKGGKTLASYLGNRGIDVAVIEQSKAMYGGTCINIACIPSKALALAAEAAYKSQFSTFEEKEAYYQKSLAEDILAWSLPLSMPVRFSCNLAGEE